MKKSLIKGLIAILMVFIFGLSAVGCEYIDKIFHKDDGVVDDGTPDDGTNDDTNDDENNDTEVLVDKTALNAEIAKTIGAESDYTAESYNAYAAKLAAAKTVAGNADATQADVDAALKALTEARAALAIKPITEVEGAVKSFNMVSGDTIELAIADYVNVGELGSITYKIKRSNAVVDISEIVDGKFTVTAGDVRHATDLTVSILVYHNDVERFKVDVAIRITNEVAPTLLQNEITEEYDLVTLVGKDALLLDFAANVKNEGALALNYSVKLNGEEITLDGTTYSLALGSYGVEATNEVFTVTVSCVANGKDVTLEYTYTISIRDTGAYSVLNGNFENGLEGWILTNTLGDAPFGGIDNKTTFWDPAFPMFNVGSYFTGIADGASEASQGTLASSFFTVNSKYATFMLGAAGNRDVYVTLENEAGEVLALYRNEKFADLPGGEFTEEEKHAMIGNTVFALNFVTYKIDLAEFAGQKLRVVLHDHASSGFGFACFDELKTYYTENEALPENAVLANNLLADKSALNAELALEITEQGDYTADSFAAYVEKLNAAKALLSDVAIAQDAVDAATKALTDARLALAVRPVLKVEDADDSFRLISDNSVEITLADFINENGLGSITYSLATGSEHITLSDIADGKFTITAGQVSKLTNATVTITVSYKGELALEVALSIEITNDLAPTLKSEGVEKKYDLYSLENKTNITLDLSDNIDNAGNLALTYSVEYNGETAKLDGATYTLTFGEYNDVVKYEEITVTVSFVANGENQSIKYTYKLAMTDSTEYRLPNGGFESGLEGWTQVGNIGGISSDKNYWVNDPESAEGFEFGMDGDNMFSGYAPGAAEKAVGTLTSSPFTVGGSGFITFKVGAMRDENYVYVDVVDAETKEILARFYNGLWADRTNDVKSGCTLIAYKADLSALRGKKVFLRISDNADSGYGLFFADSFNTYYETEPMEGFNAATAVSYEVSGTIYDVFNGGFEMGDVQGWWNDGTPGHVTNADLYFDGIEYGKDGGFLYSGVEDAYINENGETVKSGNGLEGNRGVLSSSAFLLGGNGYISYMFGGGNSLCYVQVVDVATGEVLVRAGHPKNGNPVLAKYVVDLSAHIGKTVRVQLIDNATSDWGCVSFDNLVTYHTTIPEGTPATDITSSVNYGIQNGSFESGLDGWSMNITEPGAFNTLGWVLDSEIDAGWYAQNGDIKDGNNIFTFAKPNGDNCENTKGTLESATFTLKHGAYVSFMFGGAGGAVNHDVCIELCRADGAVIARFFNDAPGKVNTRMNSYYYQYQGETADCFFRVVDNSTGDYGCFVVDAFRVNLAEAPKDYIAAIQ